MKSIEVKMTFAEEAEFRGVLQHLGRLGWMVQSPEDKTLTILHDRQGKANEMIDLAHDLHSYYN